MSLCASIDLRSPYDDPLAFVDEANRDLAGASPQEILRWAVAEFGPDLAVACSMQDAVVVDLVASVAVGVDVAFLDTGFHFPETLETARRVRERYPVNLVTLRPATSATTLHHDGIEACCAARKVEPLERYLATKRAWVTGLRRTEAATRSSAAAIEWDERRQMVKVNPIVAWDDADVERHIADHDVVVNPLRHQGYASIGCAPCTRPGTGREGRWAGEKVECGIHLAGPAGGTSAPSAGARRYRPELAVLSGDFARAPRGSE